MSALREPVILEETGTPVPEAAAELGSTRPFITVGMRPPDHFYRYRWQGRPLPSWSTLRAEAGVKAQVHAWALGGMADVALLEAGTLAAAQVNGAEEWARRRLWDAAAEAQGSSARLGTKVHEAIAAKVPSTVADDDLRDRLEQHEHWLRRSRAEVLASEFEIYNLTVGYGGTGDLLAGFPDGSIWLIDYKTGSVWAEHLLQLTGYLMGEFVGREDRVDDRLTALFRRVSGVAVLHLPGGEPDGWEFRGLRVDAEAWAAFRGLLTFARWSHDHELDDVTSSIVRGGR